MMRVIKVGGRVLGDAKLALVLAGVWQGSTPGDGHGACVVHGGGDDVTALQRAFGVTPRFVNGRRATSEQDITLLRMALSGSTNKALVASLVAAGVPAVGISGEDAALIAARPLSPAVLGAVGIPLRVNVTLLRHLLAGGYLPVVSPVSANAAEIGGGALNVNADDAAAAIAVALHADELLLIADVPAVLVDGTPIPALDSDSAMDLIGRGQADGGMAPKLEAALFALEHGVARVRIGDLAALSDHSRGTVLSSSRSAA